MTGLTGRLIMQYPITLPADYDMGIIRERVRTRGSALDDRAGLICKAYCVRDIGVDRSPVNQYAPFYLWGEVDAAADFLWQGSGFANIVRDFGRPAVRTWVPQARAFGAAPADAVTHAVVRTTPIAEDEDLVAVARRLTATTTRRGEDDRVHLAVAGIDPTSWQSVEFATLTEPTHEPGAELYRVLHISAPQPWF